MMKTGILKELQTGAAVVIFISGIGVGAGLIGMILGIQWDELAAIPIKIWLTGFVTAIAFLGGISLFCWSASRVGDILNGHKYQTLKTKGKYDQ
jgi:hypothetical protein